MYLNTNECFKLCNDGNARINTTRFGDFFVMASRGNNEEKDYYKKELNYIISKSRDVLENKNEISMVKTYVDRVDEELRYVFNNLDAFNDYVETLSKVANVEGF